jgi:hypothetical protein
MYTLSAVSFSIALIAIIIGSIPDMALNIVLAAKICVVVTLLVGLVSVVAGLMKEDKKKGVRSIRHGHRVARS